MTVMNGLELTARLKGSASTRYMSISETALKVRIEEAGTPSSISSEYVLRIVNEQPEQWEGVIKVALPVKNEAARFFMPAFLYGRNRGELEFEPGTRLFPRLKEAEADAELNIPFSDYWMVRSDRLSHPVSLVESDGRIAGLSVSPYTVIEDGKTVCWTPQQRGSFNQYNGFFCSVTCARAEVGFTLGYENAPVLYVESVIVQDRAPLQDQVFRIPGHSEIIIPFRKYESEAQDSLAVNDIIREVYDQYHQSPREGALLTQGVQDIAEAIFRDSYVPEIRNYSTQVYFQDGELVKNPLASISWTGGVEVAVPLLFASYRLNRPDMRKQALECIDHIVRNSMNEKSGLPFDAFTDGEWTTKGWWDQHFKTSGHSSYLVGQALYYILKAFDMEKKRGSLQSEWFSFCVKVLDRIGLTLNDQHEYPHLWSAETGEGMEYDSFSGAWCLASHVYLFKLTGNPGLLEQCRLSEEHYYEAYVKRMECYGTPHDTYKAVDSEGVLAYIKAVALLHQLTGEDKYLVRLRDALEYEFTFKFCYNSPVQILPLSKLGWSSSGGSVTSTCNPHVHPMSNNVLDELQYYVDLTSDAYMRSRLDDTLTWGLQTYNRLDGEFDYGLTGWMTERFCHSEGLVSEVYADGSPSSVWFCFLPWGAANVLEGMCGELWERYIEGAKEE